MRAAVEAASGWHPRLLPWFTCFTHQVATEDFAWMENSQLEYMKKIIALAPLYRLGNRGAETPPLPLHRGQRFHRKSVAELRLELRSSHPASRAF